MNIIENQLKYIENCAQMSEICWNQVKISWKTWKRIKNWLNSVWNQMKHIERSIENSIKKIIRKRTQTHSGFCSKSNPAFRGSFRGSSAEVNLLDFCLGKPLCLRERIFHWFSSVFFGILFFCCQAWVSAAHLLHMNPHLLHMSALDAESRNIICFERLPRFAFALHFQCFCCVFHWFRISFCCFPWPSYGTWVLIVVRGSFCGSRFSRTCRRAEVKPCTGEHLGLSRGRSAED